MISLMVVGLVHIGHFPMRLVRPIIRRALALCLRLLGQWRRVRVFAIRIALRLRRAMGGGCSVVVDSNKRDSLL